MDYATIGLSVFLGAVVQTTIIVMLYNHYIIPHIIMGVKEELLKSINGWVDKMTADLGQKIADELDARMLSLKRSIAGKRGRNSQMMAAATSFLTDNLSADLDDDAQQDVIAEAVATYSKPIVDAVIEKILPKKKVETTAADDNSSAGWC